MPRPGREMGDSQRCEPFLEEHRLLALTRLELHAVVTSTAAAHHARPAPPRIDRDGDRNAEEKSTSDITTIDRATQASTHGQELRTTENSRHCPTPPRNPSLLHRSTHTRSSRRIASTSAGSRASTGALSSGVIDREITGSPGMFVERPQRQPVTVAGVELDTRNGFTVRPVESVDPLRNHLCQFPRLAVADSRRG